MRVETKDLQGNWIALAVEDGQVFARAGVHGDSYGVRVDLTPQQLEFLNQAIVFMIEDARAGGSDG